MNRKKSCNQTMPLYNCNDFGPEPFVVNMNQVTRQNQTFRTALWTGEHLQLTLMCIPVGGEIGLESHPHLDQFLKVEAGFCFVQMGKEKNNLNYQKEVCPGYAIFIPAGTWHNLINTGNRPIKLYSIYTPPEHPHGTVHRTKREAEDAHHNHNE